MACAVSNEHGRQGAQSMLTGCACKHACAAERPGCTGAASCSSFAWYVAQPGPRMRTLHLSAGRSHPRFHRGEHSLRGPGPAFTTPGAASRCLSWRTATDASRQPTSAGASLAWWDSASSPTPINQSQVHPTPNAPHPAALHDTRQPMERVVAAGAALPRAVLALGARRKQNQRAGAARRAQLASSKVVQDEHT